jgi:magnesium transporter
MIRSLYYTSRKPIRSNIPSQEFGKLIRDKRSLLWIDFAGEAPETTRPILEAFGFHPLAIDDCLEETHAPKLDDWGDYLYIVLNYMHLANKGDEWETEIDELDIFLGSNYVITHHDLPLTAVDDTLAACDRDPRNLQEGADHLLYRIIDNLVAEYMPIVEKIDEAIDHIEDEIFETPHSGTLGRLFTLKRLLLSMRRILLPQREVLNKMARDDYKVIDRRDRIFFRDIYDHLVRLHDLNESLRDLVSGALDSYLSMTNNRMNEVMKILTVITTLFMPITFVTGFFGMNFFEPVAGLIGWTAPEAFLATLSIILSLPIIMFIWMRRRTWL